MNKKLRKMALPKTTDEVVDGMIFILQPTTTREDIEAENLKRYQTALKGCSKESWQEDALENLVNIINKEYDQGYLGRTAEFNYATGLIVLKTALGDGRFLVTTLKPSDLDTEVWQEMPAGTTTGRAQKGTLENPNIF